MDDERIDELIDELGGDDENPPDPSWRATIRGRRLMLTGWAPWLVRTGPLAKLLREREAEGVTIADLTVHGEDDDEISVRFLALGTEPERAEQLLIDWAERLGYRRLWLSDRLVSLGDRPEKLGAAAVRCPTCRVGWEDDSPEFWLYAKEAGTFPKWCPICGCELPQWTVASRRASASTPRRRQTAHDDRKRRTPHRP